MFSTAFHGQCPQCMLDGELIDVHLNKSDFWECWSCCLQIMAVDGSAASIMPVRGNGAIVSPPIRMTPERPFDIPLSSRPYSQNESDFIRTEEQLREHLKTVT